MAGEDQPPIDRATLFFIALMLCGLFTALAVGGFFYNHHIGNQSILDAPTQMLEVEYGNMSVATLGALAWEEESKEHHSYTLYVLGGDVAHYTNYLFNIAVQRGWLPHSKDNGYLRIIMPKEDLWMLPNEVENPYTWLSDNVDGSAAVQLTDVGETPAYVMVRTWKEDGGKATLAVSCRCA